MSAEYFVTPSSRSTLRRTRRKSEPVIKMTRSITRGLLRSESTEELKCPPLAKDYGITEVEFAGLSAAQKESLVRILVFRMEFEKADIGKDGILDSTELKVLEKRFAKACASDEETTDGIDKHTLATDSLDCLTPNALSPKAGGCLISSSDCKDADDKSHTDFTGTLSRDSDNDSDDGDLDKMPPICIETESVSVSAELVEKDTDGGVSVFRSLMESEFSDSGFPYREKCREIVDSILSSAEITSQETDELIMTLFTAHKNLYTSEPSASRTQRTYNGYESRAEREIMPMSVPLSADCMTRGSLKFEEERGIDSVSMAASGSHSELAFEPSETSFGTVISSEMIKTPPMQRASRRERQVFDRSRSQSMDVSYEVDELRQAVEHMKSKRYTNPINCELLDRLMQWIEFKGAPLVADYWRLEAEGQEMLDQISELMAQVRQYKGDLEVLFEELAAAKEQLQFKSQECEDCRESAAYLKTKLQMQSEQLLEYSQKQSELEARRMELEELKTILSTEVDTLRKENAMLFDERKYVGEKMAKYDTEYSPLKERHTEMEAVCVKVKSELSESKQELGALREENEGLYAQVLRFERVEDSRKTHDEAYRKLQRKFENVTQENEMLLSEKLFLEELLQKEETGCKQLKDEWLEAKDLLDSMTLYMEEMKEQMNQQSGEHKYQMQELNSKLEKVREANTALKQTIECLRAEVGQLETANETKGERLHVLEEERDNVSSDLKLTEERVSQLQQQCSDLQVKCSDFEQLQSEHKSLKTEKETVEIEARRLSELLSQSEEKTERISKESIVAKAQHSKALKFMEEKLQQMAAQLDEQSKCSEAAQREMSKSLEAMRAWKSTLCEDLARLKAEYSAFEQKHYLLAAEHSHLQSVEKRLTEEVQSSEEMQRKTEASLQRIAAEKQSVCEELSLLKSDHSSLEDKHSSLETEHSQLQLAEKLLSKQMQSGVAARRELCQSLEQIAAEKKSLGENLSKLRSEHSSLADKHALLEVEHLRLQSAEKQLLEVSAKCEDYEVRIGEYSSLQRTHFSLQSEHTLLRSAKHQLGEQLERSEASHREMSGILEIINAEKRALYKDMSNLKSAHSALTDKHSSLATEHSRLQLVEKQLSEMTRKCEALELRIEESECASKQKTESLESKCEELESENQRLEAMLAQSECKLGEALRWKSAAELRHNEERQKHELDLSEMAQRLEEMDRQSTAALKAKDSLIAAQSAAMKAHLRAVEGETIQVAAAGEVDTDDLWQVEDESSQRPVASGTVDFFLKIGGYIVASLLIAVSGYAVWSKLRTSTRHSLEQKRTARRRQTRHVSGKRKNSRVSFRK